MVDVELHSHGTAIAPTGNCTHPLKNVLNLFVCMKLNFFPKIFLSLSDLFPKPAPGDHESQFMKVGAIPCEPFHIGPFINSDTQKKLPLEGKVIN